MFHVNNYYKVKTILEKFVSEHSKTTSNVKILVVTKNQPIEKIKEIYDEGVRDFGENRLQEALPKIATLPNDIAWHFIGVIQTNKCRDIATNFSWVHSLTSLKAAKLLQQHATGQIKVCIQVNIDAEEQKSGVKVEELSKFAEAILQFPRLDLKGLMCLPRLRGDFQEQREPFARLRQLYAALNDKGYNLDTLSMGTSHDFEAAIAEGATILRLGRVIFAEY